MDVLMLNPFFSPYSGGTEKHVLEVGKRLAKKHGISVLTCRLPDTPENETIDGIRVVRVPSRIYYSAPYPIPPPVPIMPDFARYLRRELASADAVHMHNRFVYGQGDGALAKKAGKKLFLTLHNSRPSGVDFATDFLGGLYDDLFAKGLMRMCDGVMGVSADTLEMTLPSDYRGRTKAVYNGVDERLFRPAGPSAEWKDFFEDKGIAGRKVMTNARLLPQKGLGYLVEGMKGMDACLVVKGRGPLRKSLEAQAKKAKVGTVFIEERISEKSLAGLYNSIDAFVLPSLYEPCGIAILEALSCGKPCIGSRVNGIPEIISDAQNGLLVAPRSPEGLAGAISRVLDDKKFAQKLGACGRRKVLKEFTWDIVAKKVGGFYDSYG